MKLAVVLMQAAALAACCSGETITVGGTQWSTRPASKCKTTDSIFEYTRTRVERASTTVQFPPVGCILSCVAGRNKDVKPPEECRFVQVGAGTCTSYYFRLDQAVLGNGKRGCTATSDTVYHPRFKLVSSPSALLVAAGERERPGPASRRRRLLTQSSAFVNS
jgi:hypothetical protein